MQCGWWLVTPVIWPLTVKQRLSSPTAAFQFMEWETEWSAQSKDASFPCSLNPVQCCFGEVFLRCGLKCVLSFVVAHSGLYKYRWVCDHCIRWLRYSVCVAGQCLLSISAQSERTHTQSLRHWRKFAVYFVQIEAHRWSKDTFFFSLRCSREMTNHFGCNLFCASCKLAQRSTFRKNPHETGGRWFK